MINRTDLLSDNTDNRQQKLMQVDLEGVQNAITVDPSMLSEAVSLPSVDNGETPAYAPDERTVTSNQHQQQPTQTHEYEKLSLTDKFLDMTFFPSTVTPEMRNMAEKELRNLEHSELGIVCKWLSGQCDLPKDVEERIPTFLKTKDIEDGGSWLRRTFVTVGDTVQGAGAGAVKGAGNIIRTAVDALDWVDNNILFDTMNTSEFNRHADDFLNRIDALVPDGVCASLASSTAQVGVGMSAGGALMGTIGKAASAYNITNPMGVFLMDALKYGPSANKAQKLIQSAFASSVAFAPKEGNIFNALEQIPALKGCVMNIFAINEDDSDMVARIKNINASFISDVVFDKLFRAVGNIKKSLFNDKKPTKKQLKTFAEAVDESIESYKKNANVDAKLKGNTPDINVEDAAARAQRLFDTPDGSLMSDPMDITNLMNTKPLGPEILQEKGLESMLHLGDVTDGVNVLGRATENITHQADSDLLVKAAKALNELTPDLDSLEFLADASQEFAQGILVSRQVLVDHTRALMSVLQKLNAPDITAEAKQALIDNELTNVLKNTAKASSFFDTLSTNAGRALRAHQIPLGELVSGLNANESYTKLIDKIAVMGAAEKTALARAMTALGDSAKSVDYLKYFAQSNWKKGLNVIGEYWYNAMLSGPKTHLRNFFGNTVKQGLLMPIDNAIEGLIYRDSEAWNRGVKMYWAMKESLAEALAIARASFNLGTDILGIDNGLAALKDRSLSAVRFGVDDESTLGRFIDAIGKTVNFPTRMLTTSDAFSKQLAYRSYIRIHLYTEAEKLFTQGLGEGMSKMDFINDYIQKNFSQYFSDISTEFGVLKGAGHVIKGNNVPDAIKNVSKLALEYAKEATFQQDMHGFSKWLSEGQGKFPALRFVMPFIKTPTNIVSEAAMRIPGLAQLNPEWWRRIKAGGYEQRKAVSQLVTGSLICATAGIAVYEGMITGSGPKNQAVKDALRSQGWRPFSIKVNDTYISYEGIEPLSNILGLIADYAQLYKEMDDGNTDVSITEEGGKLLGSLLGSISNNISDRSYFRGISDFLNNLLSGDADKVKKYIDDAVLTMTTPAVVRNARRIENPEMKETRTFLDRMMNGFPLWNNDLPIKYDWITGDPVHYMGERFSGLSPIVWQTTIKDSTIEALGKVQDMLPSFPKSVNGHRLTGKQTSDFARLHGTIKIGGKTMLKAIEKAVNQMPVTADKYELAGVIDRVVRQYRDEAKKQLLKLHPELSQKNNDNNNNDAAKQYLNIAVNPQPNKAADSYIETLSKFK